MRKCIAIFAYTKYTIYVVFMNAEEIIQLLTSTPKVYAGVMPQGTFSSIICRIKAGTCKPQTMQWFFEQFGYTPVKAEITWQKKICN